jgi:hypothetical protein
LSVLDAMAAGQAAPRRSRARVEGSSGAQGAVAALPLWVLPADAPLVWAQTLRFEGDRAAVRRQSAIHVLSETSRRLAAELADRPPAA